MNVADVPSAIRDGHRLLLTRTWADERVAPEPAEPAPGPAVEAPELRIPEPPEVEELLTPPAAPASNTGSDGESFVAKVLRSEGWQVAFYTNRKGYGFDLWARREDAAMLIEVKSSLGALGAVSLTAIEYQAAQHYGDNYVLALVENIGTDHPRLWMIQNPLAKMEVQVQETMSYVITSAEWRTAAAAEE
jgi:hypothetical protein